MIVRHGPGDYELAKPSRRRLVERKPDDYDLAWSHYRVYVLAEHEWFDPHTTTRYSPDGISGHAMRGPSLIVHAKVGYKNETCEHYVNDPKVWAWIRRCIKEGYLTASTMNYGLDDERDVTVRQPQKKARTR